jgi:ribonuclease VapC
VAMHTKETGYQRLFEKVSLAGGAVVGSPTVLETAMVLAGRRAEDPRHLLIRAFRQMNVSVVPFSEEHMNVALDAFLRFGKGRHPAGLNFGDCMAYAIASVARLPLLHLDTDFSKTDIPSA